MTGNGVAQGASTLDGQGALGAATSRRSTAAFGLQLGLRQLAAARGRHALRAGAPRHEDERAVVPARPRRGHRARPASAWSAGPRPPGVARRLHDPDRGAARRGKVEIVVTGGDVVTGHDPAHREGAVARVRPQPRPTTYRASWPRRWRSATSSWRPRASRPMLALRAFGRGDVTTSATCCGPSTAGPTCRRRPPTARTSTSSRTTASCSASTSRPASPTTAPSGCTSAPTAPRRCSPTASST